MAVGEADERVRLPRAAIDPDSPSDAIPARALPPKGHEVEEIAASPPHIAAADASSFGADPGLLWIACALDRVAIFPPS
jgi:hypothetical protein